MKLLGRILSSVLNVFSMHRFGLRRCGVGGPFAAVARRQPRWNRTGGCCRALSSGESGSGGGSSENKTHFGFRDVDEDEKESLVGKVFRSVAEDYDVMNDLMSGTLHRVWKDEFVGALAPVTVPSESDVCAEVGSANVLDVAGGTGDIAFRILESACEYGETVPRNLRVTVCDINAAMLKVGERRAVERGYDDSCLSWVEGNAEKLPFDDDSFDAYTISFGIRNCTHVDKVLREAHRVLKPGGRFMCLEFSAMSSPLLQSLYDKYSFNVIPLLGEVVADDRDSYQYLVESIRKFPTQAKFAGMIRDAGFQHVKYTNFTGGIAAMHSGFKLP